MNANDSCSIMRLYILLLPVFWLLSATAEGQLIDPKFREPIKNVTTAVGREAILTCTVQDLGAYKVAWLRVDTQTILTIASHVITKNHRIGVSHGDHRSNSWSLHIREIRASDRGWYMCQINTDPMKSQNGFIDVVVPPDIIDHETSTDMIVREGSNVTLKCSASGSPPPTIAWRREDNDRIMLSDEQKVNSVEGPTLTIQKVNRLHMGSYLCIATNGIPPTVSKRIALIVHFTPMIRIEDQLVGARIGESMTLECLSEAFPKSINYWTKDKDEIIAQDGRYEPVFIENKYKVRMKLTIRSVKPSDFGTYKCVSRNSLGDTDGSINLYEITSSGHETDDYPKYKGKLKKNPGNNLLDGKQNMLREQDLELRGRKDSSNDVDEDYNDSGTSAPESIISLIILTVALVLCFQHHLGLQAHRPA